MAAPFLTGNTSNWKAAGNGNYHTAHNTHIYKGKKNGLRLKGARFSGTTTVITGSLAGGLAAMA
jgi:hypothetical protein